MGRARKKAGGLSKASRGGTGHFRGTTSPRVTLFRDLCAVERARLHRPDPLTLLCLSSRWPGPAVGFPVEGGGWGAPEGGGGFGGGLWRGGGGGGGGGGG